MSSYVSPLPLYFPSKIRFLCRQKLRFSSFPTFIRNRNLRPFSVSASIVQKDLEFSWVSPDQNFPDEYNGWGIVEAPDKEKKKKKGTTFLMIGIGAASVAALLGVIAYISLSNKGLHFRFRGHALRGVLVPSKTEEKGAESEAVNPDALKENSEVSEGSHAVVNNSFNGSVGIDSKHYGMEKQGEIARIIVPIAVDSAQQEALSVLKKLKIIEDDVKADELCTRREYARWLVRANFQLERRRKHRIVPSAALSGSGVAAFDDVSVEDRDFDHIQSLAEAGVIPSKLSGLNFASERSNFNGQECVNFFPERFISRQDLISWKAKLEYEVMTGVDEEISKKNVGFLDVREINAEVLVDLFVDILANESSILRRVFGQSKRLQPRKPCTKAQAVVALTSGRMIRFISAELSRLESENASKQITMQEIKSELIERGDIKKYWYRKMEEERIRGYKVEKAYLAAVHEHEEENVVQEKFLAEFLKQRAALDCQKQLLSSLKEDVNQMSERLAFERTQYMDEKSKLEAILYDLQLNHKGLLDAKSILEAEIEALRILRSWIEDEARKSQARAKVFEEVERRWKWCKLS